MEFGDIWNWFTGLGFQAQATIVGGFVLFCFGAYAYGVYEREGDRGIWNMVKRLIKMLVFVVVGLVVLVLKPFRRETRMPGWLRRSWTEPDPYEAQIPQKTVKPMQFPDKELPADAWWWAQKVVSKPVSLIIGPPESGKDACLIGPHLTYELMHGVADLTIMDPKAEQLMYALNNDYLRREDTDIYIYATTRELAAHVTHQFDLFALEGMQNRTTMGVLTDAPSIDEHWQDKAAQAMQRSHSVLSEGGNRASMAQVVQIFADPEVMWELIGSEPRFGAVATEEKEWNYIRSEANKALELLDPYDGDRAANVFGGQNPKMPDYTSQRRQVVFLCPDIYAGDIERAMWAAALEVIIQKHHTETPRDRYHKAAINEAASFMNLPRIKTYVNICRSSGLRIAAVVQSESQVVEAQSQASFNLLWDSSQVRIVGANASPEVAERMTRYTAPVRQEFHRPEQLGPADKRQPRQVSDKDSHELQEHHITRQTTGEWTMLIGSEAHRFTVPKSATQEAVLKAGKEVPERLKPGADPPTSGQS